MKETIDKEPTGQKKAYESPKLSSFGGIANLTQATGGNTASDHGNNLMARASA